ncbi:hypothetical protein PoB_002630900 [Plakobranchus ocellatus]|uniref:Uncharacterized protein n=1 Tax=Plakobranchus ocellatus TaxID=259542 RepID=A0AAV4A0S6_9GAST|nr:hypothetical protein PoB_002630900 [Plakobranchus ocellatus]
MLKNISKTKTSVVLNDDAVICLSSNETITCCFDVVSVSEGLYILHPISAYSRRCRSSRVTSSCRSFFFLIFLLIAHHMAIVDFAYSEGLLSVSKQQLERTKELRELSEKGV